MRTVNSSAFYFFRRCFIISKPTHQINNEIRDKEIRLVGEDGEQLGVVSSKEGLRIAEEKGLDLVKIAPQSVPPVCRIMNYGKFKFEQAKRDKDSRKNQKTVEIKEIRLSPSIDVHDFDVKVNHALRFFKDGNKVKIVVRFRGREMTHTEIGETILGRFAEACSDAAVVEKGAKLEGRQMMLFMSPKSKSQQATNGDNGKEQ